ncbi:MAG: DUF1566 domain-containing protein, partial [Candidatus Cloacimonetes bacterium]|nr:DUF1566 domain-containing protein [Candidatus Cloacimonadota bacterium]
VTIFLAHNYYAYQTNFLLDVRIVNMNGDPSMIYIGTTGVNSLTFLAIQYGSYEMTVTNPFLTTYTTHINIDSPLISRYVSLTVPGSAGGYIFYDKGYISDGWQYLEAADYLYEFEATWGASGYYMGGTFEAIGSGKQNTLFIVDWLDTQGETGKAAQLCNAMNGNGEWFLPSREELNLMHQNLCNRGVGDFGASDGTNRWHYWSSSENGTHYARGQDFSTGFMNFLYNKNGSQRVRAVRAF